jgi:Peptidase M30
MIRSTSGRKAKLQALSALCLTAFLAACGGGGGGGDPVPVPVLVPASAISFVCSGPVCNSASGNAQYGTGSTRVWTYNNTATASTMVDISLTGVIAGQSVTVIYSNGSGTATTAPLNGVSPGRVQSSLVVAADKGVSSAAGSAEHDHDDADHTKRLDNNREIIKQFLSVSGAKSAFNQAGFEALSAPTQAFYAPTAVNATKTWIDYGGAGTSPVNYATTAQATCTVPSGRNVVVWVDPVAQASGKATASSINAFASSYCGSTGGYGQIASLLGEAWGTAAAAKYSNLIPDSPLQEINIVVVNAPATAGWAGYFSGGNNFLKSASQPYSNQALVFFINANQLQASLNFTLSTLLHETTHMVNFYQRSVLKGYSHDTWLEETSAMMTEDIVGPTVIKNADLSSYNKIAVTRLPGYLGTGGAVSLINWPNLSGPNYYMGGAFGAFLNRRYGLAMYQQIATSCVDGTGLAGVTSYACLDGLIKKGGGNGYSDEFARFGASIFGALPAAGAPLGYGYPSVTSMGYTLMPIDVSAIATKIPTAAATLASGFTPTTHTYLRDTIAAGATTYTRRGIVLPANTTVSVVVK